MTEIRREELFAVIRQSAKIPANILISDSSRFVQDLGVDSLDLVGVLLSIQDTYGFELTDDEIAGIENVGDVVRLMDQRGMKLSAA
jgi:acyl carrier protein